MSLVSSPTGAGEALVTATVTVDTAPAGDLSLVLALPSGSTATPVASTWLCNFDAATATLSCTDPGSAAPGLITATVTYPHSGTATASVSAKDNDDPNPDNDSSTTHIP